MNTLTSELTEVLNDLVKINNDRVAGYEKAATEIKKTDNNADLYALFSSMMAESRDFSADLKSHIRELGGENEGESTTTMGKIYRAWMDIKATFTGHDRHSILEACEFGEDAAKKAYKNALESDAEMDADTRQLILTQQKALADSHDVIKRYRDSGK
jgi:uncharacterized protein (TIGR02284 family)